MTAIKYRELKQMYQSNGPERTVKHLREALREGELKAEDFSLRELAEATVGPEWVKRLDPRSDDGVPLLEAGDAVDVTAFANITGQIIYSTILEAYTQEAFVVSKLVDTVPTRFDGEKIPGIGRVRDEVAEVRPGMPYPSLGLSEDYIETHCSICTNGVELLLSGVESLRNTRKTKGSASENSVFLSAVLWTAAKERRQR